MLDVELFPHRQLKNHGKHYVSIMKILSSSFVCDSVSNTAVYNIHSTWRIL